MERTIPGRKRIRRRSCITGFQARAEKHGQAAHDTKMDPLALQHYLAVGGILFVIGMIGFITRRNLIVMFLCTELMFQGVAINLVAFGRYLNNDLGGQAFTIFVLVIAAAEASLALGLVVLLFRQKNTLDANAWRELKG
jgi:NADH-quinone oxidoreductase subunit K